MYPYVVLVAIGLCAAVLWILSYTNRRKSANLADFPSDVKSAGM
jgi:F0F1-type ATP synthase assembly protein I